MSRLTKVLIVDDEELIRLNLRALLEDLNYSITEAANGREGLDAFDREQPDLVLVDLRMPVMDGLFMIAELREKSPETPVIVISGTGTVRNAVDSLRLGAWDYIIKPVADIEELEIIIKRALEKARLLRENRLYREHLEDLVRERTEELCNSEARYRRLLESVTNYVYTVTLKDGLPDATVHGPGCEAVTGFTQEEYTADPYLWYRMVHEDDRPLVLDMAQRILDESLPISLEHRIYHKDGAIRWVQNTLVPHQSATGELLSYDGIVVDITEHKLAEEALHQTEEKYRVVADFTYDWEYWINPDGKFIYVSPSCKRITGYSADDFINDPDLFTKIAHPDDHDIVERHMHGIFEGNISDCSMDFRIITYYNRERWIEHICQPIFGPDGKWIGQRASNRDITERKLGEEELRQYSDEIQDLYNNAPCGYQSLDKNGVFVRINDTELNWLGYTRDEVIGKMMFSDIITAEGLKVFQETFPFFKKRGYVYDLEFKFIRKDGTVFPVLLSSTAITDKDGNYVMSNSTVYNISERERAEEEKKNLEIQLHQAQKMEAIGTLAGGIAHDFNNILTVITGYSALLKTRIDKDDPLKAYVDHITSASEKAASLTGSLLAFSRQQAIHPVPLRINDIIKGTEKLLKRLLTEDITLKTFLAEDEIMVIADATQIDQILFNLATNARDAMQKGGTLTIETKLVRFDSEFIQLHGFGELGEYTLLSISDTGTGMDEKTKGQIFDPFFTTKEVGKGTGLGLSTVYGIVKQHNGYINVDSEPNKGTTFHIYLPSIKATAKEEQPPLESVRTGRETILVAEDNFEVRCLMRDVLTQHGYTVLEAVDGEDAINKFKEHGEIDLLIFDSVMPKKNGREAYEEIIKIKPGTKVLFTSGYTRDVVLEKGIEEMEFSIISKPLLPNILLEKTREILDKHDK